MRALVLFASIALLTSAPAPPTYGRGGRQHAIAVHVDLIVFNVTVTDAKGRNVSGLTLHDFQVSEQRQTQNISLFSAEDSPMTAGLVIDYSGSMRSKRAEVVSAALALTATSQPDDELFVVTFNEHPSLGLPASVPFTKVAAEIRSALFRATPDGMTALYDALVMGIEHVTTGTHARKTLVVVSDGGDNASRSRLDDVIQLAQRSSATIFTIGIYDDTDGDRNPGALRKIAATSGGRAYFPESLRDLDGVCRDIAGRIHQQYTLGYYSTNRARDGTFRSVQITARRPGGSKLRVTSRAGYRAPDGLTR